MQYQSGVNYLSTRPLTKTKSVMQVILHKIVFTHGVNIYTPLEIIFETLEEIYQDSES